MELCSVSYIKELMRRHGFSPSKSLGQNFLTDPAIPEKIADGAGLDKDTSVLEIGPGIGALTRALARRCGEVFAIEIDKSLKPVLQETLSGVENIKVIYGDILKTDLRRFAKEHFSCRKAVAVSNLPYYITTNAITALLEPRVFGSVTVMMQKEAARKITASPSEQSWCLLSVIANHFSVPKKLFSVRREAFFPVPNVDSVVLRLDMKPSNLAAPEQEMFMAVARAVFANRRKTVLNNLSSAFESLDKNCAAAILDELNIDPQRRGESLDLPDLYRIACRLMQIIQS